MTPSCFVLFCFKGKSGVPGPRGLKGEKVSPGLRVRDTGSRGDSPERQVRQRSDWNFTAELIHQGFCFVFLSRVKEFISKKLIFSKEFLSAVFLISR